MRKIAIGILAVLVMVAMTTPAFAEKNAGDKFCRGLANVCTGWLELPKNIHDEAKESNIIQGLVVGSVKGAGYTVARTGAGAIETGTFAFPPYDEPMMDPEYVF